MALKDIIRFKFTADTSEIKKGLDSVDKQATKTGKKLKESAKGFDKAFASIAKILKAGLIIAAVKQIASFGKEIIQTTIQLQAFERRAKIVFGTAFPSIAREAKKTAASLGLSRTEFLGLTSATGDLLIPMGATREEAARIGVQALKTAAALKEFSGTTRSTAEISEVVTKAFLGEFESLKLLGISIKEKEVADRLAAKGLKDLTGKTLQLAKAREIELIITEKSADAQKAFAENTESLQRTFGRLTAAITNINESLTRTLGEALTPFIGVLAELAEGFDGFISGLNKGSLSIIAVGGIITSVLIAIGITFSAALGPIPLILAGVTAAFSGFFFVISELNPTLEDTTKQFIKNREVTKDSIDTIAKLGDKVNKTTAEVKALRDAQDSLAQAAIRLNIELRDQFGRLKDIDTIRKDIAKGEAEALKQRREELIIERDILKQKLIDVSTGKIRSRRGAKGNIRSDIADINTSLDLLDVRLAEVTDTGKGSFDGMRRSAKRTSDFLDSAFIKSIKSLKKEFNDFIRSLKKSDIGLRTEAELVFLSRRESLIRQQLSSVNEFLDNKLDVELAQIAESEKAAIQSLEDLASKDFKIFKDLEKRKAIIRAQARKKESEAELKAINKIFNATESAFSGLAQINEGGVENVLGGLGGVAGVFSPALGGILGAAGGIFGSLSSLFTDTSEIEANLRRLKTQEEARQTQIEVTNRLIEAQRDLQKQLIKLEQSRIEIIDKEVNRQIQLNNILIENPKLREQANRAVREQQITAEATRLGFSGTSKEVAQDIADTGIRDAEVVNDLGFILRATQSALQSLNALIGPIVSIETLQGARRSAIATLSDAKSQVNFEELPSNVKDFVNNQIKNLQISEKFGRVAEAANQGIAGRFTSLSGVSANANLIEDTLTGLKFELGRNDQLLSLIESFTQQQVASGEAQFELTKQREQSFVDIGRGGVREAFGIFKAPSVSLEALDLPSGIQQVALAQAATKSFSERQADSLDEAVKILRDQLETLLIIADNTSGVPSAFTEGDIDSTIADILDSIAERQVA